MRHHFPQNQSLNIGTGWGTQGQIYGGRTPLSSSPRQSLLWLPVFFLLSKRQHPDGQSLLLKKKKKVPCPHLDKLFMFVKQSEKATERSSPRAVLQIKDYLINLSLEAAGCCLGITSEEFWLNTFGLVVFFFLFRFLGIIYIHLSHLKKELQ